MRGPVLEIRGLQVAIAGKTVCRGLDLAVRGGESWAILGRNGVGKTTLLLTLAGLRAAAGGDIRVQARPLDAWHGRELARVRGLMPQDTVDAFPYTALEAVLAGRYPHQSSVMGGWGFDAAADVDLARQTLRRVGMAGFDGRDCATLSGGERRRVALAALLVQQPALYLLDEPTHHLDPHHQIALLDQLALECRSGKAALMTLHDPNLAARYCSHALLLFGDGEAQAGSRAELLTPGTLSRLYRHPMGMIDDGARRCFLPD